MFILKINQEFQSRIPIEILKAMNFFPLSISNIIEYILEQFFTECQNFRNLKLYS